MFSFILIRDYQKKKHIPKTNHANTKIGGDSGFFFDKIEMRKIFKLNEEKKNDLWCTYIEEKFRFLIIDSNENRIERGKETFTEANFRF